MITPPMGRLMDASRQRCTYSPGDTDATDCGQPATWHIAWTVELDCGLACDQHMTEAQQFAYLDRHSIGVDCGLPGSHWHFTLKRCVGPGGAEPALAAVAQATPADPKEQP